MKNTMTGRSRGGKGGRSPLVTMAVRDLDRVLDLLLDIDGETRPLPPEERDEVVREAWAALEPFDSPASPDTPPPAGFEASPLAGPAGAVQGVRARVIEDGDALRAAYAGVMAAAAQGRLGALAAGLQVGDAG